MYKRILVPLDGSSSSKKVFPHIQPLARAFDTEMILMQVLLEPAKEFSVPSSPLVPRKDVRELQTRIKSHLKKVCESLEKEELRASYLIRQGASPNRSWKWRRPCKPI